MDRSLYMRVSPRTTKNEMRTTLLDVTVFARSRDVNVGCDS